MTRTTPNALPSPRRRWWRTLLWAALGLLVTLSPLTQALNDGIRLPDIGDPANVVLSVAEERQLNAIILAQIRHSMPVVNDPELSTYIQSLGTRLVAGGLESTIGFDFAFVLIADPAINAFATPGGVIAVNTGLINNARNESELAGVMAHEIAHVEQRHMARSYAHASQVNLATALGVLASIATAFVNPQAAGAMMQSSIAAGVESQLAFSRSNEQEADRVGMELLTEAGYDPMGMPGFFERLYKATQLSVGPVPEFLSTHPVTRSRISDTRNRAEQYLHQGRGKFIEDSTQFHYAKARVLAITSNPSSLIDFYEKSMRAGKSLRDTDRYAYAIALKRSGDTRKALAVLTEIEANKSAPVPVKLAIAEVQLSANEPAKALPILKVLNDIYPGEQAIVYYLAQALLDQGNAREALSSLQKVTQHGRHNPILDELKAKAAMESGQPWLSHESLADYYMAYGQYDSAIEQFELALNDGRIPAIAQARIRSKLKELKKLKEDS